MNGVHDMGGMEGLGRIVREENEPVFHAEWEARIHALNNAMGAWGKWNIDMRRHARERIPGAQYLAASYYEKWYHGLVTQLLESGFITEAELASGRADPAAAKSTPPVGAADIRRVLARGSPFTREVAAPPAFAPGDAVRTRNQHPHGHTRLPRYARGRQGVIHAHNGAHVFPDSNAHGQGEQPHHLYSVRFEAAELWGPSAAGRDAVYIDLWEPYLERA